MHSSPPNVIGRISLAVVAAFLTQFTLYLSDRQSVCAQSATATLSGAVVDESGAVVPRVEVTALNVETGRGWETLTNNVGLFIFPSLPPANYTVTARRQGFATAKVEGVILNVNDQLALRVRLVVGQVSESMTVEDVTSIQTESPAVGTLIDREFVENLPLNGRSFYPLIESAPGAVQGRDGLFNINGQRTTANYFTVDGVGANIGMTDGPSPSESAGGSRPATGALGGANSLVSVEALQEFRVQTSTYAPEFGRSPGAQVSIVTRSGTNGFHGAVFDYLRNEALDANDWFANSRGLKKPPLRQNDFGGTLGGPVVRDRTFFFFSYEGLRVRQPQVRIVKVPSLATRRNAPSALQTLLNAFPVPNGRDFGDGYAEFAASYSNPSELDATALRVDHTVNSRLTVFGRYNYAPSAALPRGVNTILSNRQQSLFKTETLTIGLLQVVAAGITNDLRINLSESRGASYYSLDGFGGAVPPPDIELFPTFATRQDAFFDFVLESERFVTGKNADNLQRQVNVVDGLSVVAGAHQLKFGFDYRRLSPLNEIPKYNRQAFFGSLAGALAGRALFINVSTPDPSDTRSSVFTNFSAYAQDTWRPSRRLTVTYGVRWEFIPPPAERGGHRQLALTGLSDPATIALAPEGAPLWKVTHHNLAPRAGFAYQILQSRGRETVLRGGFGLFFDHLGTGAAYLSLHPYRGVTTLFDARYPVDLASARPPQVDFAPPYSVTVLDPKIKLPRTYQWNLTVEQALGTHQSLSAAYVAAAGRQLLRQERFFFPNPDFFRLDVTTNNASSDYHSMQLQFRRRFARGLQALASYTWSHSIDTASSDAFINTSPLKIEPRQDHGPSDFDVRHSLFAAATYDIPSPFTNRLATPVLRDWSIDLIFRSRSATPVNVLTGRFIFGVSDAARPDVIPGVPLYLYDPTFAGGKRINRAAFAVPATERQGTLGRNALRGFPLSQLDLSVRRQFALREGLKLQLRADLFNATNTPNFAAPVNSLNSGVFFGQSFQMLRGSFGGLNRIYQVGGPRSVQLALRLEF